MANNKKYTYDNLAEINSNGIDVALFPQIRAAIADRMKEIFGNDIDLSTASADGQYINMEALIFNNMYSLLTYIVNNLNPNSASGKYLDILAGLSNLKRKGPTYSTAQVLVKYIGNSSLAPSTIVAQDRNGVMWTWKNPVDLDNIPSYTFNNGDQMYLTFTCNDLGPVQAYKGTASGLPTDPNFWTDPNFLDVNGSIYLELTTNFLLYQSADAVVGTTNESDQSLRNRRARYIGGNSNTTQQGLETAIYNYSAIDDVYIFNNVTNTKVTLVDGSKILNHDVYVVVKYKQNILSNADLTITRKELANIIYNKLTAGVTTSDGQGSAGDSPTIIGGTINTAAIEFMAGGYTTNVYWKECSAVHPAISITFTELNSGYIEGTSSNYSVSEQAIITALNNFFNSKSISDVVSAAEIQIAMIAGDLKPNGINTFIPTACTINGTSSYSIPLAYLEYDTFTFDYTGANPTLTISHS